MRLHKLHIVNFRGFEEIELRFPPANVSVLIGINGAGKSSILDGIAMFLSPLTAWLRTMQWQRAEFRMTDGDVRAGARAATLAATFVAEGAEHSLAVGWSLVPKRPDLRAFGVYGDLLRQRLDAGGMSSLPVFCYYQANRGIGQDGDTKKTPQYPFPQIHAYDRAFNRNVGPFQLFMRWFRFEEDLENQVRLRKDSNYRSKRLQVVREAIEKFMSMLPSGEFSDLRVERRLPAGEDAGFSSHEQSVLVIDKSGSSISLDQLSDGEKTTLLLVADLAMRLCIANPGLSEPLCGEGIILIDEIDLHLHPQWQRAFLPGLLKTFPSCQFIASTHSPQALGGVHKESVFLLENFKLVSNVPPTYGRDSNSILNEIMGLPERLPDVAQQIRSIAQMIDSGALADAKEALKNLAALLGEHDTEVVRLKTLIDFLLD